MISNKRQKELATQAMRKALRLRSNTLKVALNQPIDIFQVAEQLKLRVVFKEYPSVEGMYSKGSPSTIIITSRRPRGRQAFTCGHEVGHHIFGHGDRLDEIIDWGSDVEEEFLVNCFSGHLIMPKSVVSSCFTVRGWSVSNPTEEQVFIVAGVLGVGYTTLIDHMTIVLRLLNYQTAKKLKKTAPKDIRMRLLGAPVQEDVLVVDEHWNSSHRTVDTAIDDYILVPRGTMAEGYAMVHFATNEKYEIYQAKCPGKGRLLNSKTEQASFVRVSRRNYAGFARYRYLEDEEFDCG